MKKVKDIEGVASDVKRKGYRAFKDAVEKLRRKEEEERRYNFYSFLVAKFKKGELDTNLNFSKKEHLKKLHDIFLNKKDEEDAKEKADKIDVDKNYLLYYLKQEEVLIDVLSLKNGYDYAIKEYKSAMEKVDKLITKTYDSLQKVFVEESFEFIPSTDLTPEGVFHKLKAFVESEKGKNSSAGEKFVKSCPSAFEEESKTIIQEAIRDFIDDWKEKLNKAKKSFNIMLKELFRKSELADLDFESALEKFKKEREYKELVYFEDFPTSNKYAKEFFEGYKEANSISTKRKLESQDIQATKKQNSETTVESKSSEHEEGEITD
eukprot:snap_masked-scaffold_17-processed-gene-2.40-mRNA-1 protein AED:1.00 eAED:1.00 QI:0/0/0/0/1/1/3/0/320